MDENQDLPGDFLLRELLEEWIKEDLNYIKFLNSENKVFQELREKYEGNWEIVELCREALWGNARQIAFLRRRIEDERRKIKKFG